MTNEELIQKFYTSFANGNAEGMVDCYHPDVEFEDPAFGKLKGEDAKAMWRMLLSRNSGLQVSFGNITVNEKTGNASWVANYIFTQTGRKVINNVSAVFEFADGRIIKHTDHFNLYRWAKQALGWKGFALGWTTFMKNKIQRSANGSLAKYKQNKNQ